MRTQKHSHFDVSHIILKSHTSAHSGRITLHKHILCAGVVAKANGQ